MDKSSRVDSHRRVGTLDFFYFKFAICALIPRRKQGSTLMKGMRIDKGGSMLLHRRELINFKRTSGLYTLRKVSPVFFSNCTPPNASIALKILTKGYDV